MEFSGRTGFPFSVLYCYALEALIKKGVGPDNFDQIVEI